MQNKQKLETCLISIARQRQMKVCTILAHLGMTNDGLYLCEWEQSLHYNLETILGLDLMIEIAKAPKGSFLEQLLCDCLPPLDEDTATNFFKERLTR